MDSPLFQTAKQLVADGRGVFAADASPKTLIKRGAEVGVDFNDTAVRLNYRRMTVDTPGLSQYIGGIILHEEALDLAGEVVRLGIMPGVKVDRGTVGEKEKETEGLANLSQRLEQYLRFPVRFAKWRAVLTIGANLPTIGNIDSNVGTLARFAKLSQTAGLVPIVEPEVLMEGDHTLDRCADVTRLVGKKVFVALLEQEVDLAGLLYKPNMVLAGTDCPSQPTDMEIAQQTVEVMREIVPPKVAVVVFLSGGQEARAATRRLNEIARLDSSRRWSFSFERAIEGPAMVEWAKSRDDAAAQKLLLHRARCNSLASLGKYTEGVENEV